MEPLSFLLDLLRAQMGECVGSSRIRHRHGNSKDRVETVTFDGARRLISIDDAVFRLIG